MGKWSFMEDCLKRKALCFAAERFCKQGIEMLAKVERPSGRFFVHSGHTGWCGRCMPLAEKRKEVE